MLYNLLPPLADDFALFNLFRYLTFRTGGAVMTALVMSLVIGPLVIAKLTQYQIGQTVRDEGPQSHLDKAGTPTMGGALILIVILVIAPGIALWLPSLM